MDRKRYAECVAKECGRLGIEDWEIVSSSSTSVQASMVNDELVEFSSAKDGTVSVRIIKDGREGVVTSQKSDESAVPSLVAMALANSLVKETDTSWKPEMQHGGKTYPSRKGKSGVFTDVETVKTVLGETQKELFSLDQRVSKGTGTNAASLESSSFMINSKGLDLYDSFTSSYISSSVIVRSGDEVKNANLTLEGEIARLDRKKLVEKAVSRLGEGTVPSGKYNIVFNPECMSQILSTFWSAFSGKMSCLGLSPYSREKLGTPVASSCVTLVDDPLYEDYPAQKTFDGDGEPTYTKCVIENGRLESLLYNRQWAAKAGVESTGNAVNTSAGSATLPYSFYIKNGDVSYDELLEKAGNGILVTGMKGFHAGANTVSGDFSIESSGFLIEDGKMKGPVQGFTVAGNFFSLLADIVAIADDLDFDVTLSSFRTGSPSVLVKGLSVAGKD